MRFQDITSAYQGFLAQYQSLCHQGNYNIHYKSSTVIIDGPKKEKIIRASALLYLKQWPYKVVTKHKTIDILVSGAEHFDADCTASIYSNVHVNYLDVTAAGEANVVENIHYDYQLEPDAAHPFFHAQFANNPVSDKHGRSDIGFTHTITAYDHSVRYKNLRVPTAYMNLQSVLVSLAADHMKNNVFADVIQLAQGTEHSLPEVACPRMRQAFKHGVGFCRSAHWY